MAKQKENLTLGELIKKEIKDRKLNLSAIARDLNMTPQALDQVDRKKNFSFDFLEALKKSTNGVIDFTSQATHYESAPENIFQESEEKYGKGDVDISFNISVKTHKSTINKLGALMEAFTQSAEKLGFQINY